ncbi:MAG TPA: sigma-54 dependent transcriptional regulator [Chitinivibrionales bacterium]|nr:sigma-54 dependent transcriptional regulator [Chitinivibrionales bacterium]
MARKGKLLVVDDEESLRFLLGRELAREGYTVDVVPGGEEALSRLRENPYSVVLLDIVMPGMDGIAVLRAMKAENIPSEVIMLTGNATLENAIECMKLGAFEYVKKPYQLNELVIHIERAIEHGQSQLERSMLREQVRKTAYGGGIIGKSREIRELRAIVGRVAPSQSNVLILGESGTGKEVVARSIHEQSQSGDMQFVAVSCASLPENLIESELFGYEKGAFTDAKAQKRGLAEIADGGTLFLDEIGELPLAFQAKLLRFLETGQIRRVGGTKDISLNVRILCATNRDLERLVEQKQFRDDLYYRLNVLSITVPPLRKHGEDIPMLVESMMRSQGFSGTFDESAMEVLENYDWPGNIRELRNVVERTCILCQGGAITAADVSFLKTRARPEGRAADAAPAPADAVMAPLSEVERRHIIAVLKFVKGHKGKAAEILEINPKTLYRKIKEYNIVPVYE